jgi:hypothetical protein
LYTSIRLLSSGTTTKALDAENNAGFNPEKLEDGSEEIEEAPWFLEVDPPRHPPSLHLAQLPKTPEDAPTLVDPLIKYIHEDMGLDELSLLDLRELDPPASLGPNLIMIFGTARSERHLHISSGRLVRWVKRNYNIGARADGLIGPGELKTKLRRLRKKAKLMGSNTAMIPGGDNGISTGWVCVNFEVGGSGSGSSEAASFDEGGKISGFGAARTGTTVVVQCLTDIRRKELDLETLWKGILSKSIRQGERVRGEKASDKAELEEVLASKLQLFERPSDSQWRALEQASIQQRRHYSTTARRLQVAAGASTSPTIPEHLQPSPNTSPTALSDPDLKQLRQQIIDIQYEGEPLPKERLLELIPTVLRTGSVADFTAPERLAMIDQLLATAQERGVPLWSTELLVTLLEGIITSPSYGPEFERAQRNIEQLLADTQTLPDTAQLCRLMVAYAKRANWPHFWDTFRLPPRFDVARPAELYELAFSTMAATGDARLCDEALRWVYPEMATERPPVAPIGAVYSHLRACILVADPSAEELLDNPPHLGDMEPLERRRLKKKPFVRMLREVEQIRATVERGV